MTARVNHIRAEVTGSDTATALGITAKAPAAVLALCRALVDADYDPRRRSTPTGATCCAFGCARSARRPTWRSTAAEPV